MPPVMVEHGTAGRIFNSHRPHRTRRGGAPSYSVPAGQPILNMLSPKEPMFEMGHD